MFKIKEKWENFKTGFTYLIIRIFIEKEGRKLFLKWIEMKEELISEYAFNVWVTRNILDPDEDDQIE